MEPGGFASVSVQQSQRGGNALLPTHALLPMCCSQDQTLVTGLAWASSRRQLCVPALPGACWYKSGQVYPLYGFTPGLGPIAGMPAALYVGPCPLPRVTHGTSFARARCSQSRPYRRRWGARRTSRQPEPTRSRLLPANPSSGVCILCSLGGRLLHLTVPQFPHLPSRDNVYGSRAGKPGGLAPQGLQRALKMKRPEEMPGITECCPPWPQQLFMFLGHGHA